MSSTRTFNRNITRAKLDLNPIFRVVDKVKIGGVKAKLYQNYLLEQRTVEYLSVKKPILGARMRATVSACLSLEKYFCSFSNKICCVISESIPDPHFEDEEKRCF